MLIQDLALRALFKTESDEHLQRLDDLLLRLEQTPAEPGLIEESFREAHSLKGASRMLGLKNILALANRLESSLNAARQGSVLLDRESISRMLRETGEIRQCVRVATGDDPATVAMAQQAPSPATPSTSSLASEAVAQVSSAISPISIAAAPSAAIETIRVDTRKLDELMAHAGELAVMRTRLSRRPPDIASLIDELSSAARMSPETQANNFSGITKSLDELYRASAEDSSRLEALSCLIEVTVQQIRLLPLSTIFSLFPRMVRELADEQGKFIELQITGGETLADRRILEALKDPVMHMLRNSIDHGIEAADRRKATGKTPSGLISISASSYADRVEIVVSDDGNGLNVDSIRTTARQRGLVTNEALTAMSNEQVLGLILLPGFTTKRFVTDISGRGVGMDVVQSNIKRLKGSLHIASEPGNGTSFTINVPNAMATLRVMLVESAGQQFGLPLDAVGQSRAVAATGVFTREGRNVVLYRGTPVPVTHLAQLLGMPSEPSTHPASLQSSTPCVILTVGKSSFGVFVDSLVGEEHLVLKPPSMLLAGLHHIQGAAILSSGTICTVLDPGGLLALLRTDVSVKPLARRELNLDQRKKLILLAEDSITTRTQEVRILEGAGYEVVAAIDGLDAYGKLGSRHFDAVVSDVNMPRLDGLQLAEKIRAIPEYANLPVILVTSLSSDEDKRRGLEIGANAYITKPEFDQSILLDCLERLVG